MRLSKYMTVVFPTPADRKDFKNPFLEDTPWGRATAISANDEFYRNQLIAEALNYIHDDADLREVVQSIIECPNLDTFEIPWTVPE